MDDSSCDRHSDGEVDDCTGIIDEDKLYPLVPDVDVESTGAVTILGEVTLVSRRRGDDAESGPFLLTATSSSLKGSWNVSVEW